MNKWFQLAVYALIGLIITTFAMNLIQDIGTQNVGPNYYYGPGNMGPHQRGHMGYQNDRYDDDYNYNRY